MPRARKKGWGRGGSAFVGIGVLDSPAAWAMIASLARGRVGKSVHLLLGSPKIAFH